MIALFRTIFTVVCSSCGQAYSVVLGNVKGCCCFLRSGLTINILGN